MEKELSSYGLLLLVGGNRMDAVVMLSEIKPHPSHPNILEAVACDQNDVIKC